jgi:hypothetical protein
MSRYFAGGGIGAALGSLAWSRWGWGGVCLAAIAMLILPLVRWMLPLMTQSAKQAYGPEICRPEDDSGSPLRCQLPDLKEMLPGD